jgi:hypothetical protein
MLKLRAAPPWRRVSQEQRRCLYFFGSPKKICESVQQSGRKKNVLSGNIQAAGSHRRTGQWFVYEWYARSQPRVQCAMCFDGAAASCSFIFLRLLEQTFGVKNLGKILNR